LDNLHCLLSLRLPRWFVFSLICWLLYIFEKRKREIILAVLFGWPSHFFLRSLLTLPQFRFPHRMVLITLVISSIMSEKEHNILSQDTAICSKCWSHISYQSRYCNDTRHFGWDALHLFRMPGGTDYDYCRNFIQSLIASHTNPSHQMTSQLEGHHFS